jgi:hypothetical protein
MTSPFISEPQAFTPITEDDLTNYLLQTPGFFERHAELLATVQLSSPHSGRAVSLQERQAEMLREKIRTLEHKQADMIRNGHENVALQDKLQNWLLRLLKTSDLTQLPDVVSQGLAMQFSVPQAAIRLWGVQPEWRHLPCTQGFSDDVLLFANSLHQPYCGINPGVEAGGWLEESESIRSLALIALREERGAKAFGLLVLGSPDVQRFQADMGFDFLTQIGELASAALGRMRVPA